MRVPRDNAAKRSSRRRRKNELTRTSGGSLHAREERRQDATTLTRTEAARALGVSTSTVRRLEGARLHPAIDAEGRHVFDLEEVRALGPTGARSRATTSAGELAARACELFREGKNAVDVIIALRQPFEVVLEWQRAYVEVAGSLFVPESLSRAIKEAFFVEQEPFSPEGLASLLERLTSRNLELSRRLRCPQAPGGDDGKDQGVSSVREQ
jgi:hypothetical protein